MGKQEANLLPAFGRKRILLLADAYRELAYSFQGIDDSLSDISDRREVIYRKSLTESRKIMSLRLKELAERMEEVANESLTYIAPNARKVRILKNGLAKHGILLKEIYLLRKRKGDVRFVVTMRGQRNADYTTEDIAGVLTEIFRMPLVSAKENLFFVSDEYDTYIFESCGRYIFQTGFAVATKENERVSGDNCLIYDVTGTKRVCLLSDGAGSGENACRDSEKVLELMEKYMDTGFSLEEASAMVNGLFVARGRDNLPTLDGCIIDLVEGSICFSKYGACDSYIRRGTRAERVENKNYPLGFRLKEKLGESSDKSTVDLDDIYLRDNLYELNEGDAVLMISDGVLECYGDEKSLLQTFSKMEIKDAEEAANFLMQCTIRRCAGRIRDDMTIIVGRITSVNARHT